MEVVTLLMQNRASVHLSLISVPRLQYLSAVVWDEHEQRAVCSNDLVVEKDTAWTMKVGRWPRWVISRNFALLHILVAKLRHGCNNQIFLANRTLFLEKPHKHFALRFFECSYKRLRQNAFMPQKTFLP